MDAVELSSLSANIYDAPRQPSLEDERSSRGRRCDVYIWDEAAEGSISGVSGSEDSKDSRYVIYERDMRSAVRPSNTRNNPTPDGSPSDGLSPELQRRLEARDGRRARWINIVGRSEALTGYLSRTYLADHGCLDDAHAPSQAVLGGPVPNQDGQEFVWLHAKAWFMGSRSPANWSSVEEVELRLVVLQPLGDRAGTVITNFLAPRGGGGGGGGLARPREISDICTDALVHNHAFGARALGCGWIVAYALLRTVAEQAGGAFQIFDPVSASSLASTTVGPAAAAERLPVRIPRIDDLPSILERASNLSRLERYFSQLEESASFLEAVQRTSRAEDPAAWTARQSSQREDNGAHATTTMTPSCYRLVHRAALEQERLRCRIVHSRRLSRTYLAHYENLVQVAVTYATAQITERLDRGVGIAERFATIGIFLGGVSSLLSPLALLTSYYGMNMREFVGQGGGTLTLYEFWKWGMPLVTVAALGVGYLALRVVSGARR